MSEESIDKKNVRLFRWVAAVVLLIVAGGIVWAIREDNDIVAGVTCLVMGIALVILGKKEDDAKLHIGTGIGIGVGVFFLWMCIKYLIIA